MAFSFSVEPTEQVTETFPLTALAKALESLTSDDMASMRKDFEEVFALYKEDLEKDLPASAGIEKPGHGSFAHSSEGIAAMKASRLPDGAPRGNNSEFGQQNTSFGHAKFVRKIL